MSFLSNKKKTIAGFNFFRKKFPNISLNSFSFIKGKRKPSSFHVQGLAMDINTNRDVIKAMLKYIKKENHETKFAEIGILPMTTGLHLAYKPYDSFKTRYFVEGLRTAGGRMPIYPVNNIDELIGRVT